MTTRTFCHSVACITKLGPPFLRNLQFSPNKPPTSVPLCTTSLCRQSILLLDWITSVFETGCDPQCFVYAAGCFVFVLYVWTRNSSEQFSSVISARERESVMFLIDFKILLMQKHHFQKIIIFKNCRRSVGVRSFEWTVRVSLCVFACLCLLWLSQPLRREKPLDFYCLGNKHTKLFSHHPSLFKKGKQVLWVEAMKLIDGERKKKRKKKTPVQVIWLFTCEFDQV